MIHGSTISMVLQLGFNNGSRVSRIEAIDPCRALRRACAVSFVILGIASMLSCERAKIEVKEDPVYPMADMEPNYVQLFPLRTMQPEGWISIHDKDRVFYRPREASILLTDIRVREVAYVPLDSGGYTLMLPLTTSGYDKLGRFLSTYRGDLCGLMIDGELHILGQVDGVPANPLFLGKFAVETEIASICDRIKTGGRDLRNNTGTNG